jgi:DNA polymerase III subunit beta
VGSTPSSLDDLVKNWKPKQTAAPSATPAPSTPASLDDLVKNWKPTQPTSRPIARPQATAAPPTLLAQPLRGQKGFQPAPSVSTATPAIQAEEIDPSTGKPRQNLPPGAPIPTSKMIVRHVDTRGPSIGPQRPKEFQITAAPTQDEQVALGLKEIGGFVKDVAETNIVKEATGKSWTEHYDSLVDRLKTVAKANPGYFPPQIRGGIELMKKTPDSLTNFAVELGRSVPGILDFFSTPEGLATAMLPVSAGGNLLVQRLISAGFAADMVPAAIQNIQESINKPSPEAFARALTSTIMAAGVTRHAVKPIEALTPEEGMPYQAREITPPSLTPEEALKAGLAEHGPKAAAISDLRKAVQSAKKEIQADEEATAEAARLEEQRAGQPAPKSLDDLVQQWKPGEAPAPTVKESSQVPSVTPEGKEVNPSVTPEEGKQSQREVIQPSQEGAAAKGQPSEAPAPARAAGKTATEQWESFVERRQVVLASEHPDWGISRLQAEAAKDAGPKPAEESTSRLPANAEAPAPEPPSGKPILSDKAVRVGDVYTTKDGHTYEVQKINPDGSVGYRFTNSKNGKSVDSKMAGPTFDRTTREMEKTAKAAAPEPPVKAEAPVTAPPPGAPKEEFPEAKVTFKRNQEWDTPQGSYRVLGMTPEGRVEYEFIPPSGRNRVKGTETPEDFANRMERYREITPKPKAKPPKAQAKKETAPPPAATEAAEPPVAEPKTEPPTRAAEKPVEPPKPTVAPSVERYEELQKEIRKIQKTPAYAEDTREGMALRDRAIDLEDEMRQHRAVAMAKYQADIDAEKAAREREMAPKASPKEEEVPPIVKSRVDSAIESLERADSEIAQYEKAQRKRVADYRKNHSSMTDEEAEAMYQGGMKDALELGGIGGDVSVPLGTLKTFSKTARDKKIDAAPYLKKLPERYKAELRAEPEPAKAEVGTEPPKPVDTEPSKPVTAKAKEPKPKKEKAEEQPEERRYEKLPGNVKVKLPNKIAKRVVGVLKKVIDRTINTPILQNAAIVTEKGRTKLFATDLQVAVTFDMGETGAPDGATTIPVSALDQALKGKSKEDLDINTEGTKASLSVGGGMTSSGSLGMGSYPELPEPKDKVGTIPANELTEAIRATLSAVSSEETRFTLNGALLKFDNGKGTMVSTDGHRLVMKTFDAPGVKGSHSMLIPRKGMSVSSDVFAKGEGDVKITTDENHVAVAGEDGAVQVLARKLTGNFPDYTRVLPDETQYPAKATVDRKQLLDLANRAVGLKTRSNAMGLSFRDGQVVGYATGEMEGQSVKGKASATLEGTIPNPRLNINAAYLRDFLQSTDADKVEIKIKDAGSGLVLRPDGDASETAIIMPMRDVDTNFDDGYGPAPAEVNAETTAEPPTRAEAVAPTAEPPVSAESTSRPPEQTPAAGGTIPPPGGGSVTLGGGLGALQPVVEAAAAKAKEVAEESRFIQTVVRPRLEKFAGGSREVYELLRNAVNPRGPVDPKTLNVIYKLKGGRDELNWLLDQQFQHWHKRFEDMTRPEQVQFIDRIRRGEKQTNPDGTVNQDLQDSADFMRSVDNDLWKELNKDGILQAWLDNHYRVMWKEPPTFGRQAKAERGFLGLTKRQFMGTKGFAKRHFFDDMTEGLTWTFSRNSEQTIPWAKRSAELAQRLADPKTVGRTRDKIQAEKTELDRRLAEASTVNTKQHVLDALKWVRPQDYKLVEGPHGMVDVIPYSQDAIEALKRVKGPAHMPEITEKRGGTPAYWNPQTMFQAHYADSMKYLTMRRTWDDLGKMGLRKFVPKGKSAPAGFVRVDDGMVKTYFSAPTSRILRDAENRVEEGKSDSNAEAIAEIADETAAKGQDVRIGKIIAQSGEWWVEENAGRLMNRMVSKDWIRSHVAGRFFVGAKNAFTGIELGLSPFHFVFEGNETIGSMMGVGARELWLGAGKAAVEHRYGLAKRLAYQGLKDIATAPISSIPGFRALGAAGRAADEMGVSRFSMEALGAEARRLYSEAGPSYVKEKTLKEQVAALDSRIQRMRKTNPKRQELLDQRNLIEADRQAAEGQHGAAVAAFKRTQSGKRFLERFPDAEELVHDYFMGGGKLHMDESYRIRANRSFLEAFKEARKNGEVLAQGVNALPAMNEMLLKPLFDVYIPNLKLAAFMREYSLLKVEKEGALKRGEVTSEELARRTVDFVEDRYGEMNFDNLYWHNTMKTAIQLLTRSITWKWGNLRGSKKAVEGVYKTFKDFVPAVRRGEAPALDPAAAWMLGMLTWTTALSVSMSTLLGGKKPSDIFADIAKGDFKQIAYPVIDEEGSRASIPTYFRDWLHAKQSPWGYVKSSMAGDIGRFADIVENKDFYNTEIRHPGDPLWRQGLAVAGHMVPMPFAIQSFAKARSEGRSPQAQILGGLGFTKAPAYIEQSPAEQRAHELAFSHVDPAARTSQEAEHSRLKSQLATQLYRGVDVSDKIVQNIQEGKLTQRDATDIQRMAQQAPLTRAMSRITSPNELLDVWEKADDPEKQEIVDEVMKRLDAGWRNRPYLFDERVMTRLKKLGFIQDQPPAPEPTTAPPPGAEVY